MRVSHDESVFRHIDCPVCGGDRFRIKAQLSPREFLSRERKAYYDLSAIGISDDTVFYFRECLSCQFVFVNPRLRADLYSVVYNAAKAAQYQLKSWVYEDGDLKSLCKTFYTWGSCRVLMGAIAHHRSRFAKAKNDTYARIRLLDYGCGNGHLLDLCSAFGIDAVGVDIDLHRIKLCRSKGLVVTTPDELPNSEKFDVIVSSSVIEHVDDLQGYFRYISARMRSGGIFSLNGLTPRSIDREIKSGKYKNTMPLEHLNYFNRSTLLRLAGQYGFRPALIKGVFLIETSSHYYLPFVKQVVFRGFYPTGAFEIDLLWDGVA